MTRLLLKRSMAFAALALLSALRASPAAADSLQVVKAGRLVGRFDAYRVGDDWYLGAKEASRIYGVGVSWRSAKGQVRLSLRGTPMLFEGDSDSARVGSAEVKLPRPVLLRAGRAFIPIEFFAGAEFSSLAGLESYFDSAARLLRIEQRATVGPVRFSTQSGRTRVVLELQPGLGYVKGRRGRQAIDIRVPSGYVEASTRVDVRNGVVDYLELAPASNGAALRIQFQSPTWDFKIAELDEPRRLLVDVTYPPMEARQESERRAHEAPAPPKTPLAGASSEEEPAAVAPDTEVSNVHAEGPARRGAEAPPAPVPAPARAPAAPAPKPQAAAPADPPAAKLAKVRRRIVVDAGHGGKDSGAPGVNGLEKEINLKVAKDLAAALKRTGFDVLLTRDVDVFVPLGERSRLANEFGADLFVSLHCNANVRRTENGFEIYFLSERASDPEAGRLAEFENSVLELEAKDKVEDKAASLLYALARTEFINDSSAAAGVLTKALSRAVGFADRGVKQADFVVLRGTNSPAVLVEMGFVTNRRDAARLRSASVRRRIVEGLRRGIVEFGRMKGWPSRKGA